MDKHGITILYHLICVDLAHDDDGIRIEFNDQHVAFASDFFEVLSLVHCHGWVTSSHNVSYDPSPKYLVNWCTHSTR